MNRVLSFLSLFTSFSTLICCALPALFVTIGLGATFAGLVSAVPQLIWFSEHKVMVFALAAILFLVNGLMLWWNRNAPCPIDPVQRDACIRGRKFSRNVYLFSLGLFGIGFFFAYVAPQILS